MHANNFAGLWQLVPSPPRERHLVELSLLHAPVLLACSVSPPMQPLEDSIVGASDCTHQQFSMPLCIERPAAASIGAPVHDMHTGCLLQHLPGRIEDRAPHLDVGGFLEFVSIYLKQRYVRYHLPGAQLQLARRQTTPLFGQKRHGIASPPLVHLA